MRTTALVTGATSGIGAAFADRLAGEGNNLVLVARDTERLEAKARDLRDAHDIDVEVIAADLSTDEGVTLVETRLADDERPIEMLVNNAGIGLKGSFVDNTAGAHEHLIDLNVRCVLRLGHAAMVTMVKHGHGDIINVASVAAYTPGFRSSATYSATKAFVITLTEGLAASTRNTGVRVHVVCPGFVRTEFHSRIGVGTSKIPNFMWLQPDFVVNAALRELRKGRVISVPALPYNAIVMIASFMPPNLIKKIAGIAGRRSQ